MTTVAQNPAVVLAPDPQVGSGELLDELWVAGSMSDWSLCEGGGRRRNPALGCPFRAQPAVSDMLDKSKSAEDSDKPHWPDAGSCSVLWAATDLDSFTDVAVKVARCGDHSFTDEHSFSDVRELSLHCARTGLWSGKPHRRGPP